MMRIIYRRFGDASSRPYRDSDIETAAAGSCQCDAAHTFFQNYLYHPGPIDFAASLARLGLRLQHDQSPATDPQGRPLHGRQDFQAILQKLHIGDTVTIDTKKETAATTTPHTIYMTGYTKPVITITKDPAASPKQRRLLQQWLDAN